MNDLEDIVRTEFDAVFYQRAHPEINADPIKHYLETGWRAGFDPSPHFSTNYYLSRSPDVREAGVNPFYHFLKWGRFEGRLAHPQDEDQVAASAEAEEVEKVVRGEFDIDFYCDQHPSLRENHVDPVKHYLAFGWRAGFDPSPHFSTTYYLSRSPDVREAGVNPFYHFLKWGRPEGRLAHPQDEGRVAAEADEVERVVRSEFDIDFYCDQHPELRENHVDPVKHYLAFGWRAGFDPSPHFSTTYYLSRSPDVREAGVNPFYHFLRWGRSEGRLAHPQDEGRAAASAEPDDLEKVVRAEFDIDYYSDQHPELRENHVDPVKHYLTFGWQAGFDPSPHFSTTYYLSRSPDVRDAGVNPFYHFLRWGRLEGRLAHPQDEGRVAAEADEVEKVVRAEFDIDYYCDQHPELRENHVDPIKHYLTFGWQAGFDPSPHFSTTYYLSRSPDVRDAGVNPFYHFLRWGRLEGRLAHPQDEGRVASAEAHEVEKVVRAEFDVEFYCDQHPQLRENHVDPVKHYLAFGSQAGFDPSPMFSTIHYLEYNPDIRKAEINPFYHYLKWGRAEGRPTGPSDPDLRADAIKAKAKIAHGSVDADFASKKPILVILYCRDQTEVGHFAPLLSSIDVPFSLCIIPQSRFVDIFASLPHLSQAQTNIKQLFILRPGSEASLSSRFSRFLQKELHNFYAVCTISALEISTSPVCLEWKMYNFHSLLGSSATIRACLRLVENNAAGMISADRSRFLLVKRSHHSSEVVTKDIAVIAKDCMWWMAKDLYLKVCSTSGFGDSISSFEALDNRFLLHQFRLAESAVADSSKKHFEVVTEVRYDLSSHYTRNRPYKPNRHNAVTHRGADCSASIAVYTAVTNLYDAPMLPEQTDSRTKYVCFSDHPHDLPDWPNIEQMRYFHPDPVKRARYVKTHPHTLLPGHDYWVWIDANILLRGDLYEYIDLLRKSGADLLAFRHPYRDCVYVEGAACVKLQKESASIVREQLKNYRHAGYPEQGGLFETGFLIFKADSPRIRPFLNYWWREIDTHSKRDQLSGPVAAHKAGIEIAEISRYGQSVRNHAGFAYFDHSPKSSSTVGHQAFSRRGKPNLFVEEKEGRLRKVEDKTVDVVICVHNALDFVKACIASIDPLPPNHRLILVDDGSDDETEDYLTHIAQMNPNCKLIRNPKPLGYTKSANQGLAAAEGDFVILLNSDTIVVPGWSLKLLEAAFSSEAVGIVGPLSNAAGAQSVPDIRGTGQQTAINRLPSQWRLDEIDHLCESLSVSGQYPSVPLVHGFCLGIRREVIERVGFFDEALFPFGYGEENDYCLRALDSGFELLIATHTYIYHEKSQSYPDEMRVNLMKDGRKALNDKYSRKRILSAIKTLEDNPVLIELRSKIKQLTEY